MSLSDKRIKEKLGAPPKAGRPLTPFQWQVLRETCKIPIGETRTYSGIAKLCGRPKAVRAVGQALKRNPFPLIIPCHRVVREDGTMGGYSGGGTQVKASLLQLEKEIRKRLKTK